MLALGQQFACRFLDDLEARGLFPAREGGSVSDDEHLSARGKADGLNAFPVKHVGERITFLRVGGRGHDRFFPGGETRFERSGLIAFGEVFDHDLVTTRLQGEGCLALLQRQRLPVDIDLGDFRAFYG